MSHLHVRPIDEGELANADELLANLVSGDEVLDKLARLGEVDCSTLVFGDGWAAATEVDGTSLLLRGEPRGNGARWTILAAPDAEGALHAARKLGAMIGVAPQI